MKLSFYSSFYGLMTYLIENFHYDESLYKHDK